MYRDGIGGFAVCADLSVQFRVVGLAPPSVTARSDLGRRLMMDGTLVEELVTNLTLETKVRSNAAIYTSLKNKNRSQPVLPRQTPPDRVFLVIPRQGR